MNSKNLIFSHARNPEKCILYDGIDSQFASLAFFDVQKYANVAMLMDDEWFPKRLTRFMRNLVFKYYVLLSCCLIHLIFLFCPFWFFILNVAIGFFMWNVVLFYEEMGNKLNDCWIHDFVEQKWC